MNKPKTVYKPWGKEVWLELNDRYCYKRIYINAGHKTSYQYHEYKRETNYLISGKAEIWLENDEGVVEKFIMNEGEYFNVTPPKKHRVIALTDIILQEVSTPEVDDVIRLEDDTDRKDGRLAHEHVNPALCIVAAGKGTRLGKLTKNFHKALLPVDNKAVISHIIEKTSADVDIVIALGHNGDLIKQYVDIAHPDRSITYVEIDNIDDIGSGPGYSLYKCKEFLQRPFYFTTADCLISNDLPLLDGNWLGIYPTSIPEIYSTVDVDENGLVRSFVNKSDTGYSNAFIGLCGIYEFDVFWQNLEKTLSDGEMVSAFLDVKTYKKITAKKLDWYDIGTVENYIKALNEFGKDGNVYGITKNTGQTVYKIDDKFIKFNTNDNVVSDIVSRAKELSSLIPNIISSKKNVFSYEWIDGKTLYDHNEIALYTNFLEWANTNLWSQEDVSLHEECDKFYRQKTLKRLNEYYSNRDYDFNMSYEINGTLCMKMDNIINNIDWKEFNNAIPTKLFHGDLQFDNIIKSVNDKGYTLIDWRTDFGGNVTYGDVYYDLAKLYGGICMSYKEMKDDNNIELQKNGNVVKFTYNHPLTLVEFQTIYEKWLTKNGFDLDKIKKLTALIFLNMAPLHSQKFGDLLFFKANLLLNEYYDK
jgi:NDP-sugar pyrophosphorylase family protein/mannose-6-phosphate isomerase-like protein (cupin superfamily)